MRAAAQEPGAPVSRADKVKLDRSQVARWNTLALPYLFERGGVDDDQIAVVLEDRHRTYGEMRDRARRVANGLIGLGVEPMDRVALLSSNRLEFLEIEAGIAGAQAIMVPLNWRLRRQELGNLLRRSEACGAFVEERFLAPVLELRRAGELPDLRTVIAVSDGQADLNYEELCVSASAERPPPGGRLDDPHEIIYTSGTTGEPKGVVWTNGTVLFNATQQALDFRLGPADSTYAVIDLYYIGGRHDFTWAILEQGGTVHVKPSSGFDAGEVVRYVAENRISHVLWVPTMLYDILRLPGLDQLDLSALRMIMCGGAPVSRATTERAMAAFPTADFTQVYGLTEGGGTVTFVPPRYVREKVGSAGRPSMNAEIRITGIDGRELPPGEDGEICVRAPTVTAGYWDAPRMTEETLVDGWLHTGDVGHVDEDGFLFVSGRAKDMIITGGMNVFPSEIEDVLRGHPDVADVAVIGLPDDRWGEAVCAVIEPAEGAEIVEREIIAFCSERLAGFKKPKSVRVVDALPRTASGKTQKYVLRERFGVTHPPSPAA